MSVSVDNRRKVLEEMASPTVIASPHNIIMIPRDEEPTLKRRFELPAKSPMVQWTKLFDEDDAASLTDDDEDYYSDIDEEAETAAARALVKAAFSRNVSSTPSLAKLIGASTSEPPTKKQRVAVIEEESTTKTSMRLSDPAPSLTGIGKKASGSRLGTTKPDDHLRDILIKNGAQEVKYFAAKTLDSFFLKTSDEAVKSYDMKLVQALREENVEALRDMQNAGRSLQTGNKFGETIVHAACRRNSVGILRFLLTEAGVSCRVCCDYGRTPLHDACWTSDPDWAVIELLLDACPDLLYITDKRGFTPLAYVQQEHWHGWCEFLSQRGADALVPKELL